LHSYDKLTFLAAVASESWRTAALSRQVMAGGTGGTLAAPGTARTIAAGQASCNGATDPR